MDEDKVIKRSYVMKGCDIYALEGDDILLRATETEDKNVLEISIIRPNYRPASVKIPKKAINTINAFFADGIVDDWPDDVIGEE